MRSLLRWIESGENLGREPASRERDVLAMFSAEAELTAVVEACKELLSIGCLLDTLGCWRAAVVVAAFGCWVRLMGHNRLWMWLHTLRSSSITLTSVHFRLICTVALLLMG